MPLMVRIVLRRPVYGAGVSHDPVDPVDPDVDVQWERAGRGTSPPAAPLGQGRLLTAVSVGGAAGASARYAVSVLAPPPSSWDGTVFHGWPVVNLAINVSGCAAIGVLMVLALHRWPHRPLLRPLLGTGFLGGFTTFSTYAVDVERLLGHGQALQALGYLVATPVAAVAAAALAIGATRAFVAGHVGPRGGTG